MSASVGNIYKMAVHLSVARFSTLIVTDVCKSKGPPPNEYLILVFDYLQIILINNAIV